MTEAYPLKWPEHKKRVTRREGSRFRVAFAKARDELFSELSKLGARGVVLSTNIPLKNDGKPYANYKTPDDPGAAVYFQYKEKSMCFACDRWVKIEDNIQAIRHTIAALRGIARWGTGDMLQAAFDGFVALPAPVASRVRPWWEILHAGRDWPLSHIEAQYRALAGEYHPDRPDGSHDKMTEINAAIAIARKEKAA